jgi:GntR family transcriptional regulator
MALSKKIPLYVQIETVLKSQIRMGRLREGDRLPSEKELSREYGVSPLTVRQALGALVAEGYLDRKPGRGTIIKNDFQERVVLRLSGDMDELLALGKETETRVLNCEVIKGHDKAARFLKLGPAVLIGFVEKVRYWKNLPFMVVEEFAPKSLVGSLPGRNKSAESFYFILTQRKGYILKEASQTIESSTADQRIASLLQIEMGSPLIYMERTFYEESGLPVLFQITFTRADHFKFQVHFEQVQKDREKKWAAY